MLEYLKFIFESSLTTKSDKTGTEMTLKCLKVSKAIVLSLLMCKECSPALFKSFSEVDEIS